MTSSIAFESKCIAYLNAIHKLDGEIVERAPCSGFFWRYDDDIFLLTNRHCVTGRNERNELKKSFMPTHLQAYFRTPSERRLPNGATFYDNQAIEIDLWKDGNPDWREHPEGPNVDIAAIHIGQPRQHIHCVNDKKTYEWPISAGEDCFVVGFPEGLGGSEGTPLWKRGSIATEPELKFENKPVFLIDSATREGMSGSPVYVKLYGAFTKEGRPLGQGAHANFFGHWTQFIGVYAGRNGDEAGGFQLARVWKAELVEEVVKNQCTPICPWTKA